MSNSYTMCMPHARNIQHACSTQCACCMSIYWPGKHVCCQKCNMHVFQTSTHHVTCKYLVTTTTACCIFGNLHATYTCFLASIDMQHAHCVLHACCILRACGMHIRSIWVAHSCGYLPQLNLRSPELALCLLPSQRDDVSQKVWSSLITTKYKGVYPRVSQSLLASQQTVSSTL